MSRDAEDQALREIAERLTSDAGADRCTIFKVDRDRNEVFSRVALGLPPGMEIRLPTTRGVIGFVARTGRPLRLRDAYNDPRFDPVTDQQTGYRTRSILCVPLFDSGGGVMGAIQLINKLSGAFSAEDEELANGVSGAVAAILQGEKPGASP